MVFPSKRTIGAFQVIFSRCLGLGLALGIVIFLVAASSTLPSAVVHAQTNCTSGGAYPCLIGSNLEVVSFAEVQTGGDGGGCSPNPAVFDTSATDPGFSVTVSSCTGGSGTGTFSDTQTYSLTALNGYELEALSGSMTCGVTGGDSVSFTVGSLVLNCPSESTVGAAGTVSGSTVIGPVLNGTDVITVTVTGVAGGTFTIMGYSNNISLNAPLSLTPLSLVPVTPCRVADTRNATGPLGGPSLAAQSSRSFVIPNSACGIPSTATAYSLNVTVVPSGTLGYISMWPTGQPQPLVSTLNSLDGRIKSDAAIVPAGTGGAVSVFASDATNVILDVNGYFVSAATSSALAFYPVTPCRVADTRNATGALGGPSLVGGQTRSFPVLSACGIPSSAQAYSLNFTAIPQGPLGYLSVWPAGQTQPLVSTLNAPTGTVTANAAIVPAGAGGAIDTYVTNSTDLAIDINGYFATPGMGGISLYALAPCRVLDTRQGGAQPFSGILNVNVTGFGCGVPTTAQAFVFNATVVPPGALGYLTLWPQGAAQPLVSTLNALDGSITSNMAIVPTTNGSISAFASNPTQLILDISGYFVPSTASAPVDEWTWMGGANVINQKGTYGTQGTAAPGNVPGARGESGWTDANGNLWLFGGLGFDSAGSYGILSDLWEYSAGQWTWMGGANVISQKGTYGTQGTAAPGNVPGARTFPASWVDTAGNFWLFGGVGYDSTGTVGRLNDLWKYSTSTRQWTWMGGANVISQKGTYGTQATAAPGNVPGARDLQATWTDAAGNFWLFGGSGYDSAGTYGSLNDLWKYSPSTSEWTWMGGSNVVNQNGMYGTQGTAAAGNVPGALNQAASWTDASGNLWLFGGLGLAEEVLNDLWKYSTSTGLWTWMSGSTLTDQRGTYGTQGTAAASNIPGSRDGVVGWTDTSGNFWLFGGFGYDSTGTSGSLNDLWKYSTNTGLWTWMGGSNVVNQPGTYGTQGTPAPGNVPGARTFPPSWTDATGNFWLFGGDGSTGVLNDLWKYVP